MWTNTHELMKTIHDAHIRLKTKETDPVSAHAEARLLGAATRVLAIELEHARLTNRLKEGDARLPGMTLGAAPDADLELTALAQPTAALTVASVS